MRKVLLLMLLPLMASSCYKEKKAKEEPVNFHVNDYFYIDDTKCLHSNRNCFELLYNDVRDNYRIKFVEKDMLTDSMFTYYCAKCIDEVMYEEIQHSVKYNNIIEWQPEIIEVE